MSGQHTLRQRIDPELLMFPAHQKSQDFFFSDSESHFFVSKEIQIGGTSFTDLNLPEHRLESKQAEIEEDYGFFLPFQMVGNTMQPQQNKKILSHPGNSIEPLPEMNNLEDSTILSSVQATTIAQKEVCSQKSTKERKEKNQYDKNILSNICSTVIRKMILPPNQRQIRFYCRKCKVPYKEFIDYFKSFVRKNMRFGTSELHNFFSKSESKRHSKVFGLFLTRFLNEDYLGYMLSVGKMIDEKKYLECAINLMYIPNLSSQQVCLISQFQKLI